MSTPEDHVKRFNELRSQRSTWDDHWQEIAELVYPHRADFTVAHAKGEKRNLKIYDSTPVIANELLASGLHGMLTNPATKWFELRTFSEEVNADRDVQIWLNDTEDRMNEAINSPTAGFSSAMHEVYLEYGAFGTGPLFVAEGDKLSGVRFLSRPLSEVVIAENKLGIIDTVYRQFNWTIRQMVQEWGKDAISDDSRRSLENDKMDKEVAIIHVVQPRTDFDRDKVNKINKPIASIYIEKQAKHEIAVGGFDENPYMIPRFAIAPIEVYGRGPATSSLADIKLLNEIMKTTIRGAQKVVDPPLLVTDDSVIGKMKTVPSGINYYREGSTKPEPLITGARPDIGLDVMTELRGRIRSAFFVDQLQLQEGPQMTATEVLQRTEEKLRLMGPVLGRLQTELLGPMIERVFGILSRQNAFSPPPQIIEGAPLRIEYVSPIARAQKQLEAQGVTRTIEVMTPFLNVNPTALNRFDDDAVLQKMSQLFGVSPELLKSDERVAQEQKQAQEAQQRQEQMQMAESGGRALRDTAQGAATLNR